jgi:hypothetical protein
MDQLVADFVSRMGLALPVAILVAVRAGRMINQIHTMDLERKVGDLAINVLKEKIVNQLQIEFRVYRDTTVNVNLPAEVNLQEVTEHIFDISVTERPSFLEERISSLNSIYCGLISQGTQSEYFLQVIQFLGG